MPKREDNPSPQQLRREASESESSGKSSGGKNARNVAGGKKGAASRKERKSGRH